MENRLLTHLLLLTYLHDSLLVRQCISRLYIYLPLPLSQFLSYACAHTCGGRDGEGSPFWTELYNVGSNAN